MVQKQINSATAPAMAQQIKYGMEASMLKDQAQLVEWTRQQNAAGRSDKLNAAGYLLNNATGIFEKKPINVPMAPPTNNSNLPQYLPMGADGTSSGTTSSTFNQPPISPDATTRVYSKDSSGNYSLKSSGIPDAPEKKDSSDFLTKLSEIKLQGKQ